MQLPDVNEQKAIAAVLADMNTEIEALEGRRAKTANLKQAMMQELLSGRMRITVAAPTIAATEKNLSQTAPAITAKKPHNWQINEAVIIGVLARQFGSQAWPLPRKRRVKMTYLLHRHCEGRADGYLKKAAGPYDPRTRYQGPEKIAVQNKYVAAHHNGKYEGFIAGANIDQAAGYFEKWYGGDAIKWIEQFHYEKTDELELLATVDMAMVELTSKQQASDVQGVKLVISEHPEWEAKLERDVFSDFNIARAIERCMKLFGKGCDG
jgi:type I restriction enzyme S subunit